MATHNTGVWGWIARLWERLRGGGTAGAGRSTLSARPRPAKRELVLLESIHSAALASLYSQQLWRAGIPVMPREFGGGSALLGGVPVGVSLFVPDDRLDEARAILDIAAREADASGRPQPKARLETRPDATAEGERS